MKKIVLSVLFLMFAPAAFAVDCVVSQYAEIVTDSKGREPQVAKEPGVVPPIVVTFTSESTPSARFSNRTTFVGIICNAKAHFEFGTTPVAAVDENPWIPADVMIFFGLSSSGLSVAFIEGS